jgi:CDP-glucose 4,6-dehydratase
MEKMVIQMMAQLSDFYKGKKVFVTGHTGFKGAWLSLWLFRMGAVVRGYALPPSYKEGLFDYLPSDIFEASVFADIRDIAKLNQEVSEFKPDLIFHLAAQPLVRDSYDSPVATYETNVIGTANLLESLRILDGKCSTVIVTTDKVYKNQETGQLYKESDSLGGFDPYSSSKACTEILVDSFRNSFFGLENYLSHMKSLATARAGNVIGGGDWSRDRLVPDIMRSINDEKMVEIRNPNSIRPWQHVLEPLAGYLKLGMELNNNPAEFSTAFNFGPKEDGHYTVGELVEKFIDALGRGNWNRVKSDRLKHEANLLQLDITKAREKLKWTPRLDVGDTVNWTVEWYKTIPSLRYELSLEQIKRYQNL